MHLSSSSTYSSIGKEKKKEASSELNQGLKSRMYVNLYIILTRRIIKVIIYIFLKRFKVTGFKLILSAGEEPKIAAYLMNYQSIRINEGIQGKQMFSTNFFFL